MNYIDKNNKLQTQTLEYATLVLGGSSVVNNSIGTIVESNTGKILKVIKKSLGRWRMISAASSFNGGLQIEQGELVLAANTTSSSGGGALGNVSYGYAATIGSDTISGTAALLLEPGVILASRQIIVTGSATHVAILGGIGTSGVSKFDAAGGGQSDIRIALNRNVTLQAGTGTTVMFSGVWFFVDSTNQDITIGSQGNAGVVQLNSPLPTTGRFFVQVGTLFVGATEDKWYDPGPAIPSSSGVTISLGATLAGTGKITSNISGDGLIAPNNSILKVNGQFIPTNLTSFAFTFTQTGNPVWSNSKSSANSVLRLASSSPFQSLLSSTNIVRIYFDVTSMTSGDTFRGGFYSDKTNAELEFASSIGSPAYSFFVYGDGGGSINYNGKNYYTLNQYIILNPSVTGISISVATIPTADYADGTITNGQITQFMVN